MRPEGSQFRATESPKNGMADIQPAEFVHLKPGPSDRALEFPHLRRFSLILTHFSSRPRPNHLVENRPRDPHPSECDSHQRESARGIGPAVSANFLSSNDVHHDPFALDRPHSHAAAGFDKLPIGHHIHQGLPKFRLAGRSQNRAGHPFVPNLHP